LGQRGGARLQLDVDEVGDDLGVGLRGERAPLGDELGAQRAVVLDDAVVHHADARDLVRVGVLVGGLAVGGPAGVADAELPRRRRGAQQALQGVELAAAADDLALTAVPDGDAGRVVAPVFQPAQPREQDGGAVAFADVTYNSAHGRAPGRT